MKKLFFSGLLLFLATSYLQAQKTNDSLLRLKNIELGNYYLKKSKTQKDIGSLVALGGLMLTTAGTFMYISNFDNGWSSSEASDSKTGQVLVEAGLIVLVGSIPYFVVSAENKDAAKVLLGRRDLTITRSFSISQPSIGLAIPLGRK